MLLDLLGVMFFLLPLLVFVGVVSMQFSRSVSGLISLSENSTISDNLGVQASVSVLPAQPGQLTTRVGNTSGTITMTNAGHGIITGQRVDIYFAGGQCYNATVGTVAGTSVPITAVSGGSALPALNSAVVVGIATQAIFNAVGANVQALVQQLPTGSNGYFVYDTSAPADVYAAYTTGGLLGSWHVGDAQANPVTGSTIASVWMSHNNTTTAQIMQTAALTH